MRHSEVEPPVSFPTTVIHNCSKCQGRRSVSFVAPWIAKLHLLDANFESAVILADHFFNKSAALFCV